MPTELCGRGHQRQCRRLLHLTPGRRCSRCPIAASKLPRGRVAPSRCPVPHGPGPLCTLPTQPQTASAGPPASAHTRHLSDPLEATDVGKAPLRTRRSCSYDEVLLLSPALAALHSVRVLWPLCQPCSSDMQSDMDSLASPLCQLTSTQSALVLWRPSPAGVMHLKG